jgi:hypothetical protein
MQPESGISPSEPQLTASAVYVMTATSSTAATAIAADRMTYVPLGDRYPMIGVQKGHLRSQNIKLVASSRFAPICLKRSRCISGVTVFYQIHAVAADRTCARGCAAMPHRTTPASLLGLFCLGRTL